MGILDITGLDKAEILQCLINDAVISVGWIFPYGSRRITYEECTSLLKNNETKYFDFYNGKILNINLNGHQLYTSQYNSANGENACEESLKHLLIQKSEQNAKQT